MIAADVGTVLSTGAWQVADAAPAAALAALFYLALGLGAAAMLIGVAGLAYSLRAWWHDRRHLVRRAATAPAQVIGDVPDRLRGDLLAHSCGPCNSVTGTRKCICAGNCGAQACRGGAVTYDLSGELLRITQEGRSG